VADIENMSVKAERADEIAQKE
jgi:hypothetical protein